MAFKINVSHEGKTLKVETESESLIRHRIGEKITGNLVDPSLEGYELEITGTSDISGFPGIEGQVGTHLRGVLLTKKDTGMNDSRKGVRLRKSVRGDEISEQTAQINIKVVKEGAKKFADLIGGDKGEEAKEGEEKAETKEEAPTGESNPENEPKESEEKKAEEAAPEEEPKPAEAEKEEVANPDEEPKA